MLNVDTTNNTVVVTDESLFTEVRNGIMYPLTGDETRIPDHSGALAGAAVYAAAGAVFGSVMARKRVADAKKPMLGFWL